MRNPRTLKAFSLADDLAVEVYRVTRVFPSEERYGLTNQLRRGAVSVASNLVEGCSRESQADFCRFVEIALGSAMELHYQLSLAARLGFGIDAEVKTAEAKAEVVAKTLNGLVTTLRS